MLPKVVRSNPQSIHNPNICAKDAYTYTEDQGSPTPGKTASPEGHCQPSPSLPASGLTEFIGADSTLWDTSPSKVWEFPSVKDLTPTTDVPQKQYLGVRVKMPVCELLRNIRLSRGVESSGIKETSPKVDIRKASRRTGRRKTCLEKQKTQNNHPLQSVFKTVEDLDILVEILQEDLKRSHPKIEPYETSTPFLERVSPEFLPSKWKTDGTPHQNGHRRDSSGRFASLHPFPTSGALPHPCAKDLDGHDCKQMGHRSDSGGVLQSHCMEESQGDYGVMDSMGHVHCYMRDNRSSPAGHGERESLREDSEVLDYAVQLKSGERMRQDTLAISFFQFQLQREENWLRNIPMDSLLVPDHNGNRLLHVAVLGGKRALVYALAWKFAHLNQIDVKNMQKQTALHLAVQRNHHLIVRDLISAGADVNVRDESEKTPLHLSAEKGYLKVLEVFKSCQEHGIWVDINATDKYGLTPLQCAALVHTIQVTNLANGDLSPEIQSLLHLYNDQILRGIDCLIQMGADPWLQLQEANPSSQVSRYFAKIQENNELMAFFHAHQPKSEEVILFNL